VKKRIRQLIEAARNKEDDISVPKPESMVEPSVEPVYTLDEVAKLEKLSREFVRRRFYNEPGVRRWGNRWRIPHSVLLRVMQKQTV
jgi:hypothetical protein